MGAGQFCTNPGLVLALDGPDLDAFVGAAREALRQAPADDHADAGHLPGLPKRRRAAAPSIRGVTEVARGQLASGANRGQAALFATDADETSWPTRRLREEVFGASSLVVRCRDLAAMREVLEEHGGPAHRHAADGDGDHDAARTLLPVLERKAGRMLVNGWPTGVEVCHAMVHGGPFPATSDGRTTSVGTLAIRRFLRPVCYQDLPEPLLPEALRDGNGAARSPG